MRGEQLSALLEDLAAARPGEAWQRPLAPGETVGRFELVREIGRGGFGVVYEARDRELGRAVAFKAVRPGRLPSDQAGENLVREAEAIARLSHPNLVTLYDVGRCEHGPFLVLELLRGATLKERLALGPLGVAEALRVGVEIARGLAHAHAQGVVHRDLKPSNVFLCEGGLVKVLDFGMAHAFGRTRLSGGTAAYMAPEQWRDAPEDERTDVFALGVMLHEMLAGEPPFANGGKDLQDGQTPPTLRVPDAPALGPLLARMLELDPVARPRHAGEVLEALTALRDEVRRSRTGGSTRPVLVASPPRRWTRPAALLALALVALVGLAAGLVALRNRAAAPAGRAPRVAVLPFASLSSAPDDAYFAEGIHGEIVTQLARIGDLQVIGRESVREFGPGRRDLAAAARALDAAALVEGTVQRAGPRVRITAHLVDPRSGQELWADRYDRKLDDVFAVQTEVALEIARALGARLSPAERALVERAPTRDPEAHELYRRALYFYTRSLDVDGDDRTALDLLERAVERDPAFAAAHAYLGILSAERLDCAQAAAHAARAQALQPDLPEALAAQGTVLSSCHGDERGAATFFERAVRGAPGEPAWLQALGGALTSVGEQERGLAALEAAMALEPRSYAVAGEVAWELALARRFPEARRACERARQLGPGDLFALGVCAMVPFWETGDLGPARSALGALPPRPRTSGTTGIHLMELLLLEPARTLELAAAGQLADPLSTAPDLPLAFVTGCARAELGQQEAARRDLAAAVPVLEGSAARARGYDQWYLRGLLARAYAGAGRPADALRVLEGLRASTQLSVQQRALRLREVAEVQLAAGRRGEALETLAQALRHPEGLLTPGALRADPRFAELRGDPAFEALVAPRR